MLLIPRFPIPGSTGTSTQHAAEVRRQWLARLQSGLARRLRSVWRQYAEGSRQPLAAGAAAWLAGHTGETGLSECGGESAGSPGLTTACAATLWSYGQRDLARKWMQWAISRQLACGALSDSRGTHPSLLDTAQACTAMLSLGWPELEAPLGRACRYLYSRISSQGAVAAPVDSAALDAWLVPTLRLVGLPPLLAAAEHFGEPAWKQAVWRAVAWCRRTQDFCRWSSPSHWFAWQVQALLELGLTEETGRALELPAAICRRGGATPAWPTVRWISSSGLAHLALLWYRLGERERGDRALACLHRYQRRDGGFAGSWGRGACYFPSRQTVWTARHVLEASLLQVQAAFDANSPTFESRIDPGDGRAQALRQALHGLPAGARVADIGCGKGRFLRCLAGWFPQYRWTGVDASSAMLAHLPSGVQREQGNLLNLPCRDGAFDAVFAVESLEHCLVPEQAARELCRVTRPGGRVVVIDKHRAWQPLSEHDPWEQWFQPEEVCRWLAAACQNVEARSIAHGPHDRPTGLFLCWTATRQHAASQRKAA